MDDAVETPGLGTRIGAGLVVALFVLVGGLGALAAWTGVTLVLGLGVPPRPRDGALSLFLGVLFLGFGWGPLWYRFGRVARDEARRRAILDRHPGEPWMLRDDWAARRVVHTNAGLAVFLWTFTIGWWGLLSFIGTVNRDKILAEVARAPWTSLVGLVFPLAGLLALLMAWRTTVLWWRFGRSVLHLDTLPARPGGRFRGKVQTAMTARPAGPLEATLACHSVRWVTRRIHGEKGWRTETTSHVDELWSGSASIDPARLVPDPSGLVVPLDLAVPDDQPESTPPAPSGDSIQWSVNLRVTDPSDPPYAATFEVPVFGR